MHFLAHLHLANGDPFQQIGQIAGDFAKGLELSTLHPQIVLGIRKHRRCDSFTDSHRHVLTAKELMSGPYRRYAGLVLDLYYDHLLATHWTLLTGGDLRTDTDAMYASLEDNQQHWTSGMRRFTRFLIDSDLLYRLADEQVMEDGLKRISGRLKRPVDLTPAISLVDAHAAQHRTMFLDFYPELQAVVNEVEV